MDIRVDHLLNHPRHLPLVAGWIYREFWAGRPGYSVEVFEARLRGAHDPDRIPLSLLALANGTPAGTVNLVENDNPLRPDLRPWLAALVVLPEHRRQGIGSRLVRELAAHARRLGEAELFLGTDIPHFYARLGAVEHDRLREDLWIMRLPIPSGPHASPVPGAES